jgi:hypothetical protein
MWTKMMTRSTWHLFNITYKTIHKYTIDSWHHRTSSSRHHSVSETVTRVNARRKPWIIRPNLYHGLQHPVHRLYIPYVSVHRISCPLYQSTRRHSADDGKFQILSVNKLLICAECNEPQWTVQSLMNESEEWKCTCSYRFISVAIAHVAFVNNESMIVMHHVYVSVVI